MSRSEGGVKVAHALRDKRQSHDHEAALARLKIRTEVHDETSDILKDAHFIAANAMMLCVELSGRESEALIKALLCNAIDSVGVSTDTEYGHEQEVDHSLDPPKEELVIEILDSSMERVTSSQQLQSVSSALLPEHRFNLEHNRLPSTGAAERLPPTWSVPVPPPLSPVKSRDRDYIAEESSQQWIPNQIRSSNPHLVYIDNRYRM